MKQVVRQEQVVDAAFEEYIAYQARTITQLMKKTAAMKIEMGDRLIEVLARFREHYARKASKVAPERINYKGGFRSWVKEQLGIPHTTAYHAMRVANAFRGATTEALNNMTISAMAILIFPEEKKEVMVQAALDKASSGVRIDIAEAKKIRAAAEGREIPESVARSNKKPVIPKPLYHRVRRLHALRGDDLVSVFKALEDPEVWAIVKTKVLEVNNDAGN